MSCAVRGRLVSRQRLHLLSGCCSAGTVAFFISHSSDKYTKQFSETRRCRQEFGDRVVRSPLVFMVHKNIFFSQIMNSLNANEL